MKKNGAFVNLFLSEASTNSPESGAELAHGTLRKRRKLLDKPTELL
ncbi:hypothetical protein DOQ08_02770 [Marinobacter litoralis]|uniref:Uncharacterized protein n=1 Tax=Marinobacter litoralis TaxID=187981 RepID=A0A3M2R9R1_9GAMM|nr:hypothetical protein DOQ08_02770 [Marinobacter litoralis]